MHYLFITHLYYPSIGGAELVYQTWCEELVRRGHQVTVLTSDALSTEDYFKNKNNNLKSYELLNGVHVYRHTIVSRRYYIFKILWKITNRFPILRHSIGPIFFGPHFFISQLLKIAKSVDIIIAGPTPTTVPFYGWLISKLRRKKLILFPHFHPDDQLHSASVNIWLFKHSDKIICTTDSERDSINKYTKSQTQIIRINNPFIPPQIKANQIKRVIKGKYVLFFGQEGRHKNIPLLIEAMNFLWDQGSHKDVKLVIAGRRTDFSSELDVIISINKYKSRIIRKPNPSESEKASLYKFATVFVNPSYHESFGLVFLEAWYYKLPVIGNDIPAVSEVISNNYDGFIFKHNSLLSLSKCIDIILRNSKVGTLHGINGHKNIIMNYNLKKAIFNICN